MTWSSLLYVRSPTAYPGDLLAMPVTFVALPRVRERRRMGRTRTATEEEPMGMVGRLVKSGVAAKAIQIGARELKKPENQQKIKDAVTKIKNRRQGTGTSS